MIALWASTGGEGVILSASAVPHGGQEEEDGGMGWGGRGAGGSFLSCDDTRRVKFAFYAKKFTVDYVIPPQGEFRKALNL